MPGSSSHNPWYAYAQHISVTQLVKRNRCKDTVFYVHVCGMHLHVQGARMSQQQSPELWPGCVYDDTTSCDKGYAKPDTC